MDDELESIWKEAVLSLWRYPGTHVGGIRKIKRNLNHDFRYRDRDMNSVLPDYELEHYHYSNLLAQLTSRHTSL
jgi:hypothetical protein